jgi:hypothetical protein
VTDRVHRVGRAQMIARELEQVEGLACRPDDLDDATRELVDDRADRSGRPAADVSNELDDVVWMEVSRFHRPGGIGTPSCSQIARAVCV